MGLFSSLLSFSRSSGRRKRSHRGSKHYKRKGLSMSSILSSIFSGGSRSGGPGLGKLFSSSWWS